VKNANQFLVRKLEEKRSFRRPRHRWGDTIVYHGEIGRQGMDWLHLAENRDQWQALVNTVMNLWVP
jgi:hypothetical protein